MDSVTCCLPADRLSPAPLCDAFRAFVPLQAKRTWLIPEVQLLMRNPSSFRKLLYNRQFIAGPHMFSAPEGWRQAKLARRLYVSFHPNLQVTQAAEGEREVLCLGHVFDPADPSKSNEEIVRRILSTTTTFVDFEERIYGLAGRWILFMRLDAQVRMYPDTGGSKSAFYTVGLRDGDLWIGSQPMLLGDALGLSVDHALVEEFHRHSVKNTWVGEITPYNHILQLLPNHYLDLMTGEATRFFSSYRCRNYDLNTAVQTIQQELSGILQAISSRRPTAVPLTGGHDSRALFACAGELRKTLQWFVITDPATPYHDVALPETISRRCQVPFVKIRAKRFTKEFREIMRTNLGDMYWEMGIPKMYTFGEFDHRWFVATGNMGELIRRCSYYRNGVPPPSITPELLAEKSGYGGNPVAVRAFAKWMAGVPKNSNIHILDLFYWEHRIGNWVTMCCTGLDTVCEVIPIYNSRIVLETGLAVDTEYRKDPHEMFRELCRRFAPETAGFPFNDCLRSSAVKQLQQWIPVRISEKWRWARMKLAGFDIYDATQPASSLLRQRSNGWVPLSIFPVSRNAGDDRYSLQEQRR